MDDGGREAIRHKALRLALGIGALYGLLGIAWILLSDEMVGALSTDPQWLHTAQRYKGLLYVLVTAAGLSLLVRAGYQRLLHATALASARELRALAQQEAQFRQLHQSLGEVLWLASPDGRHMLYLSPAFETLYGRPSDDCYGDMAIWLKVVHADDRALAEASNRALMAQGESQCEYRICRPDGSVRWVSDRKRAIVGANGHTVLLGGIVEDITARIERDAARATTEAELQRMVADRTAALERMNAELDAFARTAAHDMKSPLNAIGGLSHLLRRKHAAALGTEGQRMVAQIEQSTQRMAALVNDLLTLSRVSAVALTRSDVDLAALARELVEALREQEPGRQFEFVAPASLVLRCDAGLVRSLLANLIGNAWKFTGRRAVGRLTLTATPAPGGPELTLEDNGAGFDAGDGEAIFKPFQRFHSDAEFSGSGIGLVTCQRIVHRHGGSIRVESTPDVGTRVHFTLAPGEASAGPPGNGQTGTGPGAVDVARPAVLFSTC